MKRPIISLILVATLIISCAPAPASPTTPQPATATQTIPPSETPASPPKVTLIPETKERLFVTRDHEHWAILNADGSLQKYILVPEFSHLNNVSPDGKWLAYQLGAYEGTPQNHTLNLLNLDDGTSQLITHLVSPDFPENIRPIIETLSQYDVEFYEKHCQNDMECLKSFVKDDILTTVGISDWSPDSQFLAFSAQIDGPSSDIYIFNTQDNSLHRLTDDLQNTQWIRWSPTNEWIIYANNIPGINIWGQTFHLTNLEGDTTKISLPSQPTNFHWYTAYGWISDTLFLFQASYYEHPQFRQLVVLNAKNGQLTEIWPYTTEDCAVDMSNQTIVCLYESDNEPNLPSSGVYRISINGDYEKIGNQRFYRLSTSSQIVGMGIKEGPEQAYHIKSDNSISLIGPALSGHRDVSSSPNKKWFFIDDFLNGRQRLTLYSDTYQSIKSWMFDDYLSQTTWRADSLGIFLITRENIYYLSIPDGEPKLLNVELPPCSWDPIACTWPSFAWRP